MKMLGKCVPVGPGGRRCYCCGEAPRHNKRTRRTAKRRERQAVARDIRLNY